MYRILLVDDDQNIVDGLGSIIKQNFENIFVISSACDGSDALNRLTEDYYHVIIRISVCQSWMASVFWS